VCGFAEIGVASSGGALGVPPGAIDDRKNRVGLHTAVGSLDREIEALVEKRNRR
jgi:hypothetical protein